MKFILCNRDEKGHVGGDAIQLRGYQKALIELGHEAVYLNPSNWYRPTKYYDEAWVFHCNFDWSYHMFKSIELGKVPMRMIPIFYKGVYVNTNKEKILEMVTYAKSVHCLSTIERNEMIEEVGIPANMQSKITVIPNGVDKTVFSYEHTGKEMPPAKTYVTSTGRFAGEKGFQYIIEACKRIKMDVVIVGANWDESYKKSLQDMKYGTILEQLPQEHLSQVLKRATIYVCAAENERNNLALIEGIACGCKPISSPGNRGNEWFPGINIVDPKNVGALAAVIDRVNQAALPRPTYYIPTWKEIVRNIYEQKTS